MFKSTSTSIFFSVCNWFQVYIQHSIWSQFKLLDGYYHQVSSWKFEWHTWTYKGNQQNPEPLKALYCFLKVWFLLQSFLSLLQFSYFLNYELCCQAYASESVNEEYQAIAMSSVSFVFKRTLSITFSPVFQSGYWLGVILKQLKPLLSFFKLLLLLIKF